jgi:hypothetical protein
VFDLDWQKAFHHVKYTKLMQILKETRIAWRETRLISNLYMDHSVKVRADQEKTGSVKTESGATYLLHGAESFLRS